MSGWRWFVAMGLLVLAFASSMAGACSLAPFNEMFANQGTATWAGSDGDCRLESALSATSDATAAAVAHYRRQYPAETFRGSFRVSLPSGLALNSSQAVRLFRGVARSASVSGPHAARMFDVALFGNVSGSTLVLGMTTACSSQSSGQCGSTAGPLTVSDFPLRVTVELTVGAGSAGALKYWLGDDVSGPPRGMIADLDNAAWGGVERVSLGLSDSTPNFRQVLAGRSIVFDEIVAYDNGLFWSDFDSSDILALVPNAMPITSPNVVINGSTCGGTNLLSQVASGSTSMYGPVAIHPIPGGNQNIRQIQISTPSQSGSAIFLCGVGLGPASPCISAVNSGTQPLVVMPSSEDRTLVLGRVGVNDATCYPYTITVTGTLGTNEP